MTKSWPKKRQKMIWLSLVNVESHKSPAKFSKQSKFALTKTRIALQLTVSEYEWVHWNVGLPLPPQSAGWRPRPLGWLQTRSTPAFSGTSDKALTLRASYIVTVWERGRVRSLNKQVQTYNIIEVQCFYWYFIVWIFSQAICTRWAIRPHSTMCHLHILKDSVIIILLSYYNNKKRSNHFLWNVATEGKAEMIYHITKKR